MSNHRESSPEEDTATAKTVLVVEDDADIGELLVQALKEETAYQAILVSDGFQALKFVRNIKPHLFLLDYQLPSMDGLELYDHLHSIKELEDVPVLFMSASLPEREIEYRHLIATKKPFELKSF